VIVTRRMVMGGIEKSLISLLESLSTHKFEITVLLMGDGGELRNNIPDYINVQPIFGTEKSTIEKMVNKAKQGKITDSYKVGMYTLLTKFTKKIYVKELCYSRMLGIKNTKYDLAIAYHTPASFPVVYVINNIKANKKIAWIHSDISQYNTELIPYIKYYRKYDQIFCVSKYAKDKFIDKYPDLKEKTSVFYNILDKKKINDLSIGNQGFTDEFLGFRILTVGRLTSQKGQDIIPKILKKLLMHKINVRWYLIGEGESRSNLEKLINEHNLEQHLILLGNINNPYSFIKQCDIYVQPSRHEGYCITLAEARALNKPIIATDFVGAREQILDGEEGFIVKFDENEIINAIQKLIENKSLREKFTNALVNKDVTTISELDKLFRYIV
jgi:glycosyltransferase involved in cell wall biosynthesis